MFGSWFIQSGMAYKVDKKKMCIRGCNIAQWHHNSSQMYYSTYADFAAVSTCALTKQAYRAMVKYYIQRNKVLDDQLTLTDALVLHYSNTYIGTIE